MHKGKRARGSLGTHLKRLAEENYTKNILPCILDGSYWEEQVQPIFFKDLVKRYVGVNKNQMNWYVSKKVNAAFGERLATEIEIDDVEDYIDSRLNTGAAHATVYHEFAFCRAMYNVARKRWRKEYGIILNPFADAGFPNFNNARTRFIDAEEEKAMLEAASPTWFRDVLIFALDTGCRRGEMLSAVWKNNVDMQRREIRIQASKNGNYKVIPMTLRLHETLKTRQKGVEHIGTLVFPYHELAVRGAWDRVLENTKITGVRFHDLRHTFGSRLAQQGVDILRIKELMGHKSINMTMRYAHLNTENLRAAISKLDGCHNTATMKTPKVAATGTNGLK